MKIIINQEFCQKIWKTHISHVKEPNRTRKMRELCFKMMHENHKKVNPRNRGKVQNGIRDFLKRTFRRVEKVDNLSKQVIFSETEFRKNNTMGWILQKENANEIISEATSSQTRQNQKRKNFEEDLEMDKKILNRRLVYEPTVPRKKRKDS